MKEKFGGKTVLILSIVFATILAGCLFFMFKKDKIEVIVATQNVRENQMVNSSMFAVAEFDKAYAPTNYIPAKYISDLNGRYTNYGFTTGQVITFDTMPTDDAANKAAYIETGKTLYSISTNNMPQGVRAKDHVNILISIDLENAGTAVLTFQNVYVTNIYEDEDGTVTGIEVSVTPEQAQKIQFAVSNGDVAISLLPPTYQTEDLDIMDESTFESEYQMEVKSEENAVDEEVIID